MPSQDDFIQIQHINDYYDLQRKATEFKGNNWVLSLACLSKAKREAEDSDIVLTNQNLLRLPLFLQQAGKFEEAKTELQYLFDSADEYASSQVGNWTNHKAL
ncbi:hypothetical protein A1D23_08175 [Chelonobacter oris]|nr:hypothetical protein [Chelonobacter oris]